MQASDDNEPFVFEIQEIQQWDNKCDFASSCYLTTTFTYGDKSQIFVSFFGTPFERNYTEGHTSSAQWKTSVPLIAWNIHLWRVSEKVSKL